MTAKDGHERVGVLGVQISAVNLKQAANIIAQWVSQGAKHYVCVTTVHGVMECQRDPRLMEIYNTSGIATADGMPLVWILRSRGHANLTRVYGPDLMLEICHNSVERGYRHFIYGGAPGVAESLAQTLAGSLEGIKIVGTHSPPFRDLTETEDREIVKEINSARPDIVWVGLGTPKQERWMADHVERLNASALIGVGAAFDFLSGKKAQAPRWMQRMGLEWAFRLAMEPRRLWKRYLIYNPWFLYKLGVEAIRSR
ncbi:MAG: WecB/TagA/CpsF family glycosyltransferase [Anaerolineales bacterium]